MTMRCSAGRNESPRASSERGVWGIARADPRCGELGQPTQREVGAGESRFGPTQCPQRRDVAAAGRFEGAGELDPDAMRRAECLGIPRLSSLRQQQVGQRNRGAVAPVPIVRSARNYVGVINEQRGRRDVVTVGDGDRRGGDQVQDLHQCSRHLGQQRGRLVEQLLRSSTVTEPGQVGGELEGDFHVEVAIADGAEMPLQCGEVVADVVDAATEPGDLETGKHGPRVGIRCDRRCGAVEHELGAVEIAGPPMGDVAEPVDGRRPAVVEHTVLHVRQRREDAGGVGVDVGDRRRADAQQRRRRGGTGGGQNGHSFVQLGHAGDVVGPPSDQPVVEDDGNLAVDVAGRPESGGRGGEQRRRVERETGGQFDRRGELGSRLLPVRRRQHPVPAPERRPVASRQGLDLDGADGRHHLVPRLRLHEQADRRVVAAGVPMHLRRQSSAGVGFAIGQPAPQHRAPERVQRDPPTASALHERHTRDECLDAIDTRYDRRRNCIIAPACRGEARQLMGAGVTDRRQHFLPHVLEDEVRARRRRQLGNRRPTTRGRQDRHIDTAGLGKQSQLRPVEQEIRFHDPLELLTGREAGDRNRHRRTRRQHEMTVARQLGHHARQHVGAVRVGGNLMNIVEHQADAARSGKPHRPHHRIQRSTLVTPSASPRPASNTPASASAGSHESHTSRSPDRRDGSDIADTSNAVLPNPGPATIVTIRRSHRRASGASSLERATIPPGNAGGCNRNGPPTARRVLPTHSPFDHQVGRPDVTGPC